MIRSAVAMSLIQIYRYNFLIIVIHRTWMDNIPRPTSFPGEGTEVCMLNVCPNCGQYRADKAIDSTGPFAVCPVCGARQPFRRLPLLIVSGASGSGKTTACRHLVRMGLPEVIPLDTDILWGPAFDRPEENYRNFFDTWLRLCKNIHQAGRSVVLFGAGVGVPENLEACAERRYFSDVHYLALVCTESELRARLEARPAWRESHHPAFIEEQVRFNVWFSDYDAAPPIRRLDTTGADPAGTARRVAAWIRGVLPSDHPIK